MSDTPPPIAPNTDPIPPLRIVSGETPSGHELDKTPNKHLFGFVGLAIAFMLFGGIGVYQLFSARIADEKAAAASVMSRDLAAQHTRDASFATTFGATKPEGEATKYRVPYAEAKAIVLKDPARFAPAPAPEGWVHPDDL